MRPRSTARLYNTAGRLWLTAAGLSLLLPARERLGWWLPLHLVLAGAISIAVSGAMQNFASTLTATPTPRLELVLAQFTLVNLGAALLALGRPSGHPGVVAVGGTLFLLGIALLGWFVVAARRRSLHRRHMLPLVLYQGAVVAVLIGGTLGALIGSGAVRDGGLYAALRRTHMTLNVLGWISLTISGTLITLLPTVLRIRMPVWQGRATGALLAGGVTGLSAGFALRVEPLAAAGGLLYAAGASGIAWMVARVLRTPRKWPVPAVARHLLVAVVWWLAGAFALAVAVVRGTEQFDLFRQPFLVMFVGGWATQTLLGAWLYLLPMGKPGHPDERRGFLTAMELGGRLQLVALNAGFLLMLLRSGGWVPDGAGMAGVGLALAGGGIALSKAWLYAPMSRRSEASERTKAIWGG